MLEHALITGSSGMVGNHIPFGLRPSSSILDVTKMNSIRTYVSDKPISCIIHLASVNLRECETNCSKSIRVNIQGAANMVLIAKELNVPFVLISSGAVFSSENSNAVFDEKCIPCPNSVYGETKYAAEQIALSYPKSIVIRTGWLFGGHQKTHYKFVETVMNHLRTNTPVYASNDFFGSPTYVKDMIEHMKVLLLQENYGIHHVVNSGHASGYDIACEIASLLQKDTSNIKSVPSTSIPNPGPYRSKSECLTSVHSLRSWKESLSAYIQQSPDLPSVEVVPYWKNRQMCRLCNHPELYTFYKFKPTALANQFVSSPRPQDKLPLDLCICMKCSHIQLLQIVNPTELYVNYLYVSSISPVMVRHLETSVDFFIDSLALTPADSILEIGANDGTLIRYLLQRGFTRTMGIDPAANIHSRHDLPILCDFFGSSSMHRFTTKFKLIFGFHCCAHIETINDVFQCIYDLLEDKGVFVMEVGYFYEVLKTMAFDVVYHEHIDYHTCKVANEFGKKHQLTLYHVKETPIQGGSIQFFFSKDKDVLIDPSVSRQICKEEGLHQIESLIQFQTKIDRIIKDVHILLVGLMNAGYTIAGYGASAKSTTLLHQLLTNSTSLKYIIDDNVYKQNMYSPGLHIPIKPLNELTVQKVDYVIILSCNFSQQFLEKLEPYRKTGLRIIIPFPEIKII